MKADIGLETSALNPALNETSFYSDTILPESPKCARNGPYVSSI